MKKIALVLSAATLSITGILFALMFFSGFSPSEYIDGSCDIKDYKTVKIGDQIWMAENLNCYVINSKCYGNDPANCAKYGRLYDWPTALALPSKCDNTSCANQINAPHRGICPANWHIPSNKEWNTLYSFAGDTIADSTVGASIPREDPSNKEWNTLYSFVGDTVGASRPRENPTAGKHLKATEGWFNCGSYGSGKTYLCEDSFGFSAMPGGIGNLDGNFSNFGGYGFWWSIKEHDLLKAYGRDITNNSDYANWLIRDKNFLFSVRCLRD
jgi:uncharacterized protein (TIGR02145 family)